MTKAHNKALHLTAIPLRSIAAGYASVKQSEAPRLQGGAS